MELYKDSPPLPLWHVINGMSPFQPTFKMLLTSDPCQFKSEKQLSTLKFFDMYNTHIIKSPILVI